jgi:nucleotide-binding universal stress UspA family protein
MLFPVFVKFSTFRVRKIKPLTMHRVLIPVDFSVTSFNAARFAAEMLAGKKDMVAILYHQYEKEEEGDICASYLESLRQEMLDKGVAEVEYEKAMGGDLIENLDRLAHTRRATLIAMGITGKSALQQTLIGSNTLKMVDRRICPVMIIPPDATFSDIKNVAFASEFIDVENTTPCTLINAVLEMFNPNLHIVNVNPEHYVSITDEFRQGKAKFQDMFKDYTTEFYFIGMNDFHEAIDNFIRDYHIDLLVTIPRHHSNSRSLFKSTHTKKLAYHSNVPLLAAHE